MSQTPKFVGIDDGYVETKICMPDGNTFRIASRARAGESEKIAVGDGAVPSVQTYVTGDGSFCVGDIRKADATASDNYPASTLNRVIVSHALREAGLGHKNRLAIASGLPIRRYYRSGRPNRELIRAKTANLLKNDVRGRDGLVLAQIVSHEVFAEAVAAWVDFVIDRDASGKLRKNDHIDDCVAIIDIGGRTTDIAVVQGWEMDADRSSTVNVGMLDVRRHVMEHLESEYNGITESQAIRAVETGRINAFGREIDVSEIVDQAKKTVAGRVRSEVDRCLGSAIDIQHVIFVGGTTVALKPLLRDWFPHQTIPQDPEFANARGLQKCAEALFGGGELS